VKNRIYTWNRRLSTGAALERRRLTTGRRVVVACLALTLSVIPGLALAQDVTIAPKLAAGDEFRLALVRTRDNSAQPQQNSTSRTVISVRVTSAGADGYVLDWVPGETVVDNQQLAQNPVVMAAVEAVRGLRFRLTLNADGELTGLANQDEILPKLKSMMDTIVQQILAGIPDDERTAMVSFMNQVLSPEALVSSATREAGIYFGLNGVSLASGEVAEIELQQPSPFGGGVIPGIFRVRMDSITTNSVSLTTETTYDSTALLRLTESLIKQAGKPIPPSELAKVPPIDMNDDGTFVFDRTVGLMREVTMIRRVVAGTNQRLDRWEMRLLDGPKR
jgi:hypothetical protein